MNLFQMGYSPTVAMRQNARLLIAACAVFALAACSSGVKLNELPPVEDRTGSSVGAQPAAPVPPVTSSVPNTVGNTAGTGVAGASVNSRIVEPVTLGSDAASLAGPAKAAKIIYFDYDSYSIKPEYQSSLDAHAKFLASNKIRKMAIEGHTDERGGREYNLALGQKRSEAVRRALALLGVTDIQIEAVSFGKEKPATGGSDEASLALNRRAEINYK